MKRVYKGKICLPGRQQRRLLPIIFVSLITAVTMTACQPATIQTVENTRQIERTTSPVSLPAPEPKEAETGTDIVGNIISQLETTDDLAEDAPAPADEVLTVAVGQSSAINTDSDTRAALAQQATHVQRARPSQLSVSLAPRSPTAARESALPARRGASSRWRPSSIAMSAGLAITAGRAAASSVLATVAALAM